MRTHVLAAVAGAALLGLTGCGDSIVAPPAAATAAPSASPSAPAKPVDAGTPSKPVDVSTGTKPVTAAKTPAVKKTARSNGCPVKPATLERAAHLSTRHRIEAADVKCSQGWATAGLTAVDPKLQGDGVLVFEYSASTGTWRKRGEGSAIRCGDFGMPKRTGLCYAGD